VFARRTINLETEIDDIDFEDEERYDTKHITRFPKEIIKLVMIQMRLSQQ
jgi:hypothetical protein